MRKINIKLWIVFIFFVTASCSKSPEETEKKYLTNAIEQIAVDSQYQWLVVLPGLGCHGCIQEGEFFMQEYIDNQQILFVLTKVSSLKILQQKTEVRISEHPNIYVDKDNLFAVPSDNNIYPCVIQLKEGKMVKHSFQSPQNDAFYQLEQIVKK
ncbi:hypothetical protein FACS189426_20690 [Bacteroidia bacterium]|nr:hypothetical protein FACS189426_20690 [Bacteroidia bacterium]